MPSRSVGCVRITAARIGQLDAVRGVSALSVLFYHYTTRFDELYGHPRALATYFPWGRYGVQVFFIISGFVILMTLERTRKPLDFVVSRLTRLYPAYWVAIFLTYSIVHLAGLPGRQTTLGEALANLSMLHFWFGVPSVDGVYWSLQCEVLFYAVMLLIYMTGQIKNIELVASAWITLQGICLVSQSLLNSRWPGVAKTLLLLDYVHLFVIGLMLYRIRVAGPRYYRLALLFLCLAIQWLNGDSVVGNVFVSCSVALLLAVALGKASFASWRPLVFLGDISYGLYLLHQYIGYALLRWLYAAGWPPPAAILVTALASLALASALTYGIDKPAVRISRDWYRQLRSGVTQALAGPTP